LDSKCIKSIWQPVSGADPLAGFKGACSWQRRAGKEQMGHHHPLLPISGSTTDDDVE